MCLSKEKRPRQENALTEGIRKLKIAEHSIYLSPLFKIDQATLLEGRRRGQSKKSTCSVEFNHKQGEVARLM